MQFLSVIGSWNGLYLNQYWLIVNLFQGGKSILINKANVSDLIAATGQEIFLKYMKSLIWSVWPWNLTDDIIKQ